MWTSEVPLHTFVENFVVAVDFQSEEVVSPGSVLLDFPEWDSLAALGVIVMCDTEYGVMITGDDLKACRTVEDIYAKVALRKAA